MAQGTPTPGEWTPASRRHRFVQQGLHPPLQLQEQTLSFGVKLIAVIATLFVLGGWLCGEILRYAVEIFNNFYLL